MICKNTGIRPNDQHFSEQMQYFKYLVGKSNSYKVEEAILNDKKMQ